MHSPTFDDHRPLVASRRNSLKLIAGGLLSASGVLVACGGGSDASSATTTDTTSTGGTTGTGGTTTATTTTFNALWIPPLLAGVTTAGVTTYELTLANSAVQYRSGAKTATCGYNGHDFWGPTLLMKKGSTARMQLKNTLAEDTTTHWHGLLVPGPVDGGPHQIVAAGATWLTDAFTVKNNAATYWYHPHLHGMTQKQLTLGAGGIILVQDDAEAALNLPRTYGTDDIPLILTSRRFTTTNGVANQFQTTTTAYGDVLLSGGDCLMVDDDNLEYIIKRLRAIPHVEIVRLGSRTPVVCPQRITPELCNMLKKYHPIWLNTHFNTPKEFSPEAAKACAMLADAGIPLGNQSVLLAGVNDCIHVMMDLVHGLVQMRVRPYYIYACDPSLGLSHFRTPVSKGIEIMEALRGHTSGYCIPTFVVDAPGGGGKTPVMPTYLISQTPRKVILRNFEGVITSYTQPEHYVQNCHCDVCMGKKKVEKTGVAWVAEGTKQRYLEPTKLLRNERHVKK